ncbi:serine/threonine-protein kinase [Kitasatospora cineracea]|uniref:serine/threonine-protein kinase n=1 Tax=Kitasatospora cineracea TaxID=88074 RepID=UPI003429B2A4
MGLPWGHQELQGETVEDRYQLVRLIGSGGMGTVYEAEDLMLRRRVAVKLMHGSVSSDENTGERFLREAMAMARTSHPNVVALHDAGVFRHTSYLVMELLDGLDLGVLVNTQGALPPGVIRVVVESICSGLVAVHQTGVLHRDLKPHNVRVTAAGLVVLQDFGLARLVEASMITAAGSVLGTPQYLAPEVVRGERPTQRTDLYGVGVILYHMLTGRPPLERTDNLAGLFFRLVNQGVPPLADSRPDLPADLVALSDRLTALRAEDRPASAAEVLEHLTRPTDPDRMTLGTLVRISALKRPPDGRADPFDFPSRTAVVPRRSTSLSYSYARHPLAVRVPSSTSSTATLSPATRLRLASTADAPTRLREAVALAQRGDHSEAAYILDALTKVCTEASGPTDPTALAAQFWHAVCLSKLGAAPQALHLFAQVTDRTSEEGN